MELKLLNLYRLLYLNKVKNVYGGYIELLNLYRLLYLNRALEDKDFLNMLELNLYRLLYLNDEETRVTSELLFD